LFGLVDRIAAPIGLQNKCSCGNRVPFPPAVGWWHTGVETS
jgi:hypothetical protein